MIIAAFYVCCFAIVYPYAVYPLLLAVLSRFHSKSLQPGSEKPFITFIISAYNEERVIAAKIENSISLDYPADKRLILVVSDCSTDRTDEIVRSYAQQGVAIIAMPSRQGKTAGLNEAVRTAKGEVIVFSDADSMYDIKALAKIAETFSGEPRVGLVTGSTRYQSAGDGTMVDTSSTYTKLEHYIKRMETALGSCVGADGAIFAVRRVLYQPLRDDDINDLVIPFKIVRQKYRAVMRDDLFCYETSASDEGKEFQRQIRITARTLRALFRNIDLMNPVRYPLFGYQLVSHKLVRFLAPFVMIALFIINTTLLGQGIFYAFTWIAQMMTYGFSIIRYALDRTGRKSSGLNFVYHFVMINVAILGGWLRFLSGEKTVTWNPRGR